ncbi:hypothetical protein [Runella slithyformis]|uniref:Yip1 domain-containing protein n=1 Tax=Runella slithyformis (strain ATCC 29530 / DSM 19594 / LMG 11500 / NCIMB 11436 / LSU 4) TaxID=761193 RepID=A0A7U3ZP06_RUNSL|nr:hypothetical protein [Runella slithyformis]AEI50722.1 hypothetical protein Runsl_4393 [Runella slithyformis DSM 19594]
MDKRLLFLLLIAALSGLVFLSNYLFISENLYFNTFAEQLTYEQIENIINQSKQWEWISYAILPILTLIKLTLVTSCLSIGLYFLTNQFSFKLAFGIALDAEFVFLIPSLLKILWFSIIQTDYSLQDLQMFYPLSALHFFDYTNVQPWLIYPLQLLNVFEILYWVLLAKGVSQIIERDFAKSFELVLASYGTGLVLWVTVVMFITVSFTP